MTKYWNGSCWKEHSEPLKVVSASYGIEFSFTKEEVDAHEPLNLTQLMRDEYNAARDAEEERAGRTGVLFVNQTLSRPVRLCDFDRCAEEMNHEGNHRDKDGRRLTVSIAPQTEAQRNSRTIGPIKMDARRDDRRDSPAIVCGECNGSEDGTMACVCVKP